MSKEKIKFSGIIILALSGILRFRHHVTYKCSYREGTVKLSVDRWRSRCLFCNMPTNRSDNYYYRVTKGNEVLLKYRLERCSELQWARARAVISNDTLNIEHGDGYMLFVISLPLVNNGKISIKQAPVEVYEGRSDGAVGYRSRIDSLYAAYKKRLSPVEVQNILNAYCLFDY